MLTIKESVYQDHVILDMLGKTVISVRRDMVAMELFALRVRMQVPRNKALGDRVGVRACRAHGVAPIPQPRPAGLVVGPTGLEPMTSSL